MAKRYGVFGHVADDAYGDGFPMRDEGGDIDDAVDDDAVNDDVNDAVDGSVNDDDGNLNGGAAVFGASGTLSANDATVPYRQGRSVWFGDDEDGDGDGDDAYGDNGSRLGLHGGQMSRGLRGPQGKRLVPMAALKNDVVTSTSNAVLDRARGIQRRASTLLIDPAYSEDRHTGYAELDSVLRGVTSPSSRYQTNLQFDLETGEVAGGDCTCPAYGRGYGICKHMAALALIFCDEPQRFDGYHAGASRPSRPLLEYMERLDKRDAQARARRRSAIMRRFEDDGKGRGTSGRSRASASGSGGYQALSETVGPGQVRLSPILSYISGTWSVEFKIGSVHSNTSYVLKSIPQFVLAMAHGEYGNYGRKLAFTHTPDMLDADSLPLLGLLASALAVRKAAERQDRYYGHIAIDRHLALSEAEVSTLLNLREGKGVQLVLDTWFSGQPSPVLVEGGEAELGLSLTRRDFNVYGPDAGYLLTGQPAVETVVVGDGCPWLLLASDQRYSGYAMTSMIGRTAHISASGCRFVRCPQRVRPLIGLMSELFEPDGAGQVIAGDDTALFARTLLPQLVSAGLLEADEIPRELTSLSPAECSPQFYLDRDEHGVECTISARYGEAIVPLLPARAAASVPSASGISPSSAAGPRAVPGRDLDAEHLALDVVGEFFTMPERGAASADAPNVTDVAVINRDDTMQLIRLFDEGLAALHDLGEVFTTPAFDRLIAPKPPSVKVGLAVKGNLVEISPIADEVPPDEVGALLSSYRRRQHYHQLRDGTLVKLDGANLGTLDKLAEDLDLDESQLDSGSIELPGSQAFLLEGELPDDGSDVVKDSSFTDYIDDLAIIDPSSTQVPSSLQHVLRPYQAEGFRWLNTLCDKGFGGILADEMGLGKSVQFIALLMFRYQHMEGAFAPSLIVCPASLVYNWAAEFAKFAPSFNAVVVAGSKSERRTAIARAFGADEPTVIITSYDLLRRDIDDYTATDRPDAPGASDSATDAAADGADDAALDADAASDAAAAADIRVPRRFSIMALDEAQYIKNHTTKIAKAVKSVAADHRFALTGTPIENRLSELWSIFDYLMPGLLGSYKRFRERYELPISNARAADSSTDQGRAAAQINPESARVAHKLQSLVGVFIKRRLKSQVLTDLPDKLETTFTVRLEGEQRKLYAAHEQRLRMQLEHSEETDFNTSKIRILAELTKLRQICCDPRLLYANAKDQSAKLAAITELAETCVNEGKKALIFSQFTSFLSLIADRFDAHGLGYYTITGSTPKKRRLELVDRFNADDTPAFLISLKAGNTGLNLTGASVVIHADPWWNAAAQDQATDRAHRIGQIQDVNVYQVVAKDTIEERILELQHTKSELARQFTDASLLSGETGTGSFAGEAPASIATLTKDDLLDLLG